MLWEQRYIGGGATDCREILHGSAYMFQACILSFWALYR